MHGLSAAEIDALFAPVGGAGKLGLAVSGGADSLALMLLAQAWAAARGGPKLIVYTLDHRLRPEAADEAAMVVREATALGLPARALVWDDTKPTAGMQAAAREARYRLIAAAMARDDVQILLTAHHLADQAETILMRLAHGSGIDGLRGMDRRSVVAGCEIFRPLLDVDPLVLRQIIDAAGLVPADDPTNRDRDYERVRWRQALPQLAALGLDAKRLNVFARRAAEISAMIATAADTAYAALVIRPSANAVELPHRDFALLAPPIAVRLLGRVLEEVADNPKPPPLAPLEALCAHLANPAPMKRTTLHGCVIASTSEVIVVRREGPRNPTRRSA